MDPAVLDLMLAGLPRVTDANVLLGFSHKDDAAVYRLPSGEQIVQTVDFFTPVVDDPFDYGQIAAANSLSDIYAMNARPLFALNIACFPKSQPPELWREVLRGGAAKAAEAGIAIVGGHTVDDTEPKYGLVVTGIVEPGRVWANEGARAGDTLILTKRIGTGLLTTLLKDGAVTEAQLADAVASMKELNRVAAAVLARFDVHACTDITGFGLLGHAGELCAASGVGMRFRASQVPLFPLARTLAVSRKFPGGTKVNRLYLGDRVTAAADVDEGLLWLLFDAQTSGGLLASLSPAQAEAALAALQEAGVEAAAIVGEVTESAGILVEA
ncbi:selenide, water dikinase SelD [candidate division KSB1 bacterium]|nr:selenide, water dikinase SelD [candidate division KSB1 bacterium]